jgi:hypothetical protein
MTLNRVRIPSPNYSTRGAATVRLIVIHSSEGAQTYQSLGNFFANPSSGVSSHVGIDNASPGVIGEYVARSGKAWTAAGANPVAVQAECCTPPGASAAWSRYTWLAQTVMMANLAAWVAEEAAAFGIPIVALSPAQAQGSGRGVCQHVDLGSWGGGHVDCGPGFPMADVLAMAGGGAGTSTPPPGPTPPPPATSPAPPWPGRYLEYPPLMSGPDVAQWQEQMHFRGWTLVVDGVYGPESQDICVEFQTEKHLTVDGIVGPDTWAAAWTAPIT